MARRTNGLGAWPHLPALAEVPDATEHLEWLLRIPLAWERLLTSFPSLKKARASDLALEKRCPYTGSRSSFVNTMTKPACISRQRGSRARAHQHHELRAVSVPQPRHRDDGPPSPSTAGRTRPQRAARASQAARGALRLRVRHAEATQFPLRLPHSSGWPVSPEPRPVRSDQAFPLQRTTMLAPRTRPWLRRGTRRRSTLCRASPWHPRRCRCPKRHCRSR